MPYRFHAATYSRRRAVHRGEATVEYGHESIVNSVRAAIEYASSEHSRSYAQATRAEYMPGNGTCRCVPYIRARQLTESLPNLRASFLSLSGMCTALPTSSRRESLRASSLHPQSSQVRAESSRIHHPFVYGRDSSRKDAVHGMGFRPQRKECGSGLVNDLPVFLLDVCQFST